MIRIDRGNLIVGQLQIAVCGDQVIVIGIQYPAKHQAKFISFQLILYLAVFITKSIGKRNDEFMIVCQFDALRLGISIGVLVFRHFCRKLLSLAAFLSKQPLNLDIGAQVADGNRIRKLQSVQGVLKHIGGSELGKIQRISIRSDQAVNAIIQRDHR